jgi:hypothetical protein
MTTLGLAPVPPFTSTSCAIPVSSYVARACYGPHRRPITFPARQPQLKAYNLVTIAIQLLETRNYCYRAVSSQD